MRTGDIVRLDGPTRVTSDAHAMIVAMAAGKAVLNVGAAGNARWYRDHGSEDWLHKRLATEAGRLVGLDIDEAEIAAARDLGFDILIGNCETTALRDTFDLIVLSDVIEHLGNPGQALANLAAHLVPDGRIVITTPNATSAGMLLGALAGRRPNVYWDHVACYTPEHVQALCDRHGYRLEDTAYFTLADRRTPALRLRSKMIATIGHFWPRIHGSFVCVIGLPHQG